MPFLARRNQIPQKKKYNNTQKSEKELRVELQNNILRNIKIEVTTSRSTDESIIDVTSDSYRINTIGDLKKYNNGVPYWAHHYVYSYSEIYSATHEQKQFYIHFKNSFLNGVYYDLEGNSNYAFILLFNLLEEYDKSKDIIELEKHIKVLGKCYPKTKSYGISFLIQKMEAKGDSDGASRLRTQDRYEYQNNYTDYDYWRLGSKYKKKLNLNDDEVKLLNKLWYPSNNFCSVEYCCLEILKLYILVIDKLEAKYNQDGTTIEKQFVAVADVIAKAHFKYREGSNNYKYCIETTINEFYSIIFKYCENAVREHYGHKRKINTDTYYTTPEAKIEFETKIILEVTNALPTLVSNIALPDEATEIELNTQNTTRWKIKFDELTENFNSNSKQFIEDIISLGNLNKKNPSIENIFFEASKFIAKSDKEAALILYIYYLHYDLKSAVFDNKQLTKTIQKSLFKTNEQLHEFEIVVSEFINDKDLEKALKGVSNIYAVKRKKIKLDSNSIKEVQEQHSGTVELLNEYLKDEYEDENNFIKTHEISNEEVEIEITNKSEKAYSSIYLNNLAFTQIHTAILEMFEKNNFTVSQIELEAFAKSKGLFKNQLIESINEACYEVLDDVLIEEDDEYHVINPNYYQLLLAK